MKVGAAWADITPDKPIPIRGQMRLRLGEYTHDPLTVNAVALVDSETQVVLVSCDLCAMAEATIRMMQNECSEKLGIPASSVIIACTHTHLAPFTEDSFYGSTDEGFLACLKQSIVKVVGDALSDAEDAVLYAGKGCIEQMGFNRRGLHHGGERADMYHGSWREGFCGVEGPRDGETPVIFAKRPDGSVKVVIPSFASHPNSVESECFYSADFVGAVRAFLRKNLGDDVGIVYLTGAAGNTAPSQLENNPENIQPWRGEDGWKRSGMYLGSEILKTIMATVDPMESQKLDVRHTVVQVGMRPWPEWFKPGSEEFPWASEYYKKVQEEYPRRLKEDVPVSFSLHVLRIGDAVICTNPAELYVEHGLAIKKDSPADVTVVAELTDGCVGYVPTQDAFKRGGYSTWPSAGSSLAPDAGDKIVEQTKDMLEQAFP